LCSDNNLFLKLICATFAMKTVVIFAMLVAASRANYYNQWVYSDSSCSTNVQTLSSPDGSTNGCSANSGGSNYLTCDASAQTYTAYSCTGSTCASCTNLGTFPATTCSAAGTGYSKTSCTTSFPSIPSGDVHVNLYQKSDCSDSAPSLAFTVLNTCFPSGEGTISEKNTQSGNTVTQTKYYDSSCNTAVNSTTASPNPITIQLDGNCHLFGGSSSTTYYKGTNTAGHVVASVALIAALIAALLSL